MWKLKNIIILFKKKTKNVFIDFFYKEKNVAAAVATKYCNNCSLNETKNSLLF